MVRAQGPLGRWADKNFEWVMSHLSDTQEEVAQKTHRWNNHHLRPSNLEHLNSDWMVSHKGNPNARKLPRIPILAGALAHATRYGGWRHYLVITPEANVSSWYVGWRWKGGGGVSRIKNQGAARVLVGPNQTEWFGIETHFQHQVPIKIIGEGHIGNKSMFSKIPLF